MAPGPRGSSSGCSACWKLGHVHPTPGASCRGHRTKQEPGVTPRVAGTDTHAEQCDPAPARTRTFHVAPFSLEALLRPSGLFLPPGLPSKSVKKSGGSAGLCQRGQQIGTVTWPRTLTPGTQMGTSYKRMGGPGRQQGTLLWRPKLKIMFFSPDLTTPPGRGIHTPLPWPPQHRRKSTARAGEGREHIGLEAHTSTCGQGSHHSSCPPRPRLAPWEGHAQPVPTLVRQGGSRQGVT